MKLLSRKNKDRFQYGLVFSSAAICVLVLLVIIGFIFKNGLPMLSYQFFTNDYEGKTFYIDLESDKTYEKPNLSEGEYWVDKYGVALKDIEVEGKDVVVISDLANDSILKTIKSGTGEVLDARKGFIIEQVKLDNKIYTLKTSNIEEIASIMSNDDIQIKISNPGGGIWPLIVSTILLILLTLLFSIPLGVLSAIYLTEYAKPGRITKLISFATETLAGIPSIIYGLFGMLVFTKLLGFGQSLISGALTLSIILLPIMMRTTEEALKTVPMSYREASYGLGANKLQTLWKVVLPSSIPGILVGVILSVGRIVGESAALLFTLGTFAQLPINPETGNLSIFKTGTTLTVRAYAEVKEYGNIEMASAIGVTILIIVFVLNISSKLILKKINKAVY